MSHRQWVKSNREKEGREMVAVCRKTLIDAVIRLLHVIAERSSFFVIGECSLFFLSPVSFCSRNQNYCPSCVGCVSDTPVEI